MKTTAWKTALIGGLLASTAAPLIADNEYTDSLETEFLRDGQITVTLSAGVHKIVRSEDEYIRIHWTVGNENDEVVASTSVEGNTAMIDVDGPREDFRSVIEVPGKSDLKLRLTAGVLTVQDTGGDRDIRLRAGELFIEVDDAKNYANVAGSLWAGDIDAGPFKQSTSGLFRSIKWEGEGEEALQFKLYAGNVRLYRSEEQ